MTLRDSVELWEIATGIPGTDYLNDCAISDKISKPDLWDYLMFEFMDMSVVDSDSRFFHERVKNFFAIHKWNIDELLKSLDYEYDPLNNTHWKQNEVSDEHYTRDRDDNWQRDETIDKTDDWDRQYDEKGNKSGSDVNFVSAYNDNKSPEGVGDKVVYNDEEHDRQTHSETYSFEGNEHKQEQIHQTEDETKNEQEDITDDTHKNKDTTWSGNKGQSYQSLIEEQRQTVQFNIYKWIARHFCKELLIAVW